MALESEKSLNMGQETKSEKKLKEKKIELFCSSIGYHQVY